MDLARTLPCPTELQTFSAGYAESKVRKVAEMGNLDKEFPLILLIQRINGEHYCIQKVYK